MFNDDGLAGMLEAADIKNLEMISPFIGALLDSICSQCDTFPITEVCMKNVDVMN